MRFPRIGAIFPVLLACTVARPLVAQNAPARQWEPPGFDFTPNGVWRVRARRVAAAREAALRRGNLAALNAPLSSASFASSMAVGGVLNEPVFLARFKNTDTTQ